jgi:phosphoribosyl-ATP pyrophosphohydrolase/phosphoribosyl-AMP cyclohydrolase
LIENIKFDEKGLVPAIAQDADTGEVLMLAYMNEEALRRTLSSGEAWFYSRSRNKLWHKGETSGNRIKVRSVLKDCDSDTILIIGKPTGPVCHTGNKTCFFQYLTKQDIEAGHPEED